jgi:hypothetical protein
MDLAEMISGFSMKGRKTDNGSGSIAAFNAIKQFRGIRSQLLRIFLRILPYILVLGSTLVIAATKDTYIMYCSMILAVALSILVLNFLMNSIPSALCTLWTQKSIAAKVQIFLNDNSSQGNMTDLFEDPSDPIQSDREYAQFTNDFEDSLNFNLGQLITGIAFAIILFGRAIFEFWKWLPQEFWTGLIYKAGGWDALIEGVKLNFYVYFTEYSVEEPLRFWTGITFEPFLGFILGIIAWRMVITSRYIRKLGQNFDLIPQPENLDKCGGFKPLGNLSFINALIISIWGAFLGGWIIIGSSTKYGSFYTPIYEIFFLVPIIMAVLTFLVPLWGIHVIMDEKKAYAMQELGQLSSKIHLLRQKRLDSALSLEPEASNLDIELERLKKVYEENREYPTWPFDYRILIAFITSQAVPLLGLTGIGQPTYNIIQSLLDFINQYAGTR